MRVNVRTVAEFYFEGGDLTRQGDALARMQEGTRGHQALQAAYPPGWEKEVPISGDVTSEGLTLRLYGRMDGVCMAGTPCLEEIKTTERPIADIGADDVPVHWAQAELYGALLAQNEELAVVSIRLTYLNLAGGKVSFTRTLTREALMERLHTYLVPYARFMKSLLRWQEVSRPSMRELAFPFAVYRAGQREMAANIYIALRDSRRLMCQAPTGIGKTMAALYPALKALGEEHIERIFFLTARTTGQRTAGDALRRMREQGLMARSVTLSAREKVCVQPDLPCDPEHCARARGYYDRRREALLEALSLQALTPEAVQELAARHTLCPFELSLDLSEISDVVICDYNYAFDPRVKLQRFFTNRSQAALLIDEAHNLCARARDMLSATLCQRAFRDLRAHIGKAASRKHALYRALTALLNEFKALRGEEAGECILSDPPADLIRQARETQAVLGEHMNIAAPWQNELTEAFFALLDFTRCAESYAARDSAESASPDYRTLLVPDGRTMTDVTLLSVNPAPHLDKALRRVHGAALFSATLSPLPFYRDVSGLLPPPAEDALPAGKRQSLPDALLDLPSPFPPENLLVLRAPLPVRYRQREQSLPQLARLIHAFLTAHRGNYMVFFPSYAYLRQALDALTPLLNEADDIRILVQSREMDDETRAAFLHEFQPDPEHTLAGFAVLGGAFSEGVDLAGSRLTGAVIVGTGVPQVGAVNDALSEVYESRFGSGYRYAYLYPGVTRVLQAAGRVIRSETDRGAVLLIDARWNDREHLSLLPPHWRIHALPSGPQTEEALRQTLSRFWQE